MKIKKIILKSKSWLLTPLESDTVLSYVFWFAFSMSKKDVIDIFYDFKNWNLSFILSNWFSIWFLNWKKVTILPKPIYFIENQKKDNSLITDVKNEPLRKRIKKIKFLPAKKKYFKAVFNGNFFEVVKNELIDENKFKILQKSEIIWKNQIPRFNSWDTNIYSVEVNYSLEYIIFVKILDEEKFKKFFNFMKEVFEIIWYGAWKSRWFWKFKNIKLEDLNKDEKELFDYFKELKKQWKIYILNNFKPKNEEIELIDTEKSFIEINFKNAKTIQEWNKQYFKGNLNFIKAGSVLVLKEKKDLIGDYYVSWNSYNFGYLF